MMDARVVTSKEVDGWLPLWQSYNVHVGADSLFGLVSEYEGRLVGCPCLYSVGAVLRASSARFGSHARSYTGTSAFGGLLTKSPANAPQIDGNGDSRRDRAEAVPKIAARRCQRTSARDICL